MGWTDAEVAMDEVAVEQFQSSMDDDFNTPGAIAVLFGIAKELQRQNNLIVHNGKVDADSDKLQQQWQTLTTLASVLGLEAQAIESEVGSSDISDAEIEDMIAQRAAAKKAKDYAESDRLRDALPAQGITLIDKPGGITDWHR